MYSKRISVVLTRINNFYLIKSHNMLPVNLNFNINLVVKM